MRCIVYVSTATPQMSSQALELLLVESNRLNRENGITGVLLHDEGNFMQCIEGPAQALADTYARILASRRHGGVIKLMDEVVKSRTFGAWHMGNAGVPRSRMLSLSTANWEHVQVEVGKAPVPPAAFELLAQFWRNSAAVDHAL